jgi:hypothetical protein
MQGEVPFTEKTVFSVLCFGYLVVCCPNIPSVHRQHGSCWCLSLEGHRKKRKNKMEYDGGGGEGGIQRDQTS